MTRVKKNLLANGITNVWMPLVLFLSMRYYKQLMGDEGLGLVGLFMTLQVVCSLLNMGLDTALNRELSRLSAGGNKQQAMADTLATLQVVHWLLAAALIAVMVAAAPLAGRYWISAEHLSRQQIATVIILMGLALGLQLPTFLYSGGLMGLQHQVLLSVVNILMYTLRFGGAVAVLMFVKPTLSWFFAWQACTAGVHSLAVAVLLWQRMPTGVRGRPCWERLRSLRAFVAGNAGIVVTAIALTQLDKLILSKWLDMGEFAYYSTASLVALAIYRIPMTTFAALFPQMTHLASRGEAEELKLLYHRGAQVLSVFVFPFAAVLAMFSGEVMLLWLGDRVFADNAAPLLTVLMAGAALHCIGNIPYALQLASGWTKLTFSVNLAAVAVMALLVVALTSAFGPVGAAVGWAGTCATTTVVTVPLMHKRLLAGELKSWAVGDVLAPMLAAVTAAAAVRLLMPADWPAVRQLPWIVAAGVVSLLSAGLAAKVTREWVLSRFGLMSSAPRGAAAATETDQSRAGG